MHTLATNSRFCLFWLPNNTALQEKVVKYRSASVQMLSIWAYRHLNDCSGPALSGSVQEWDAEDVWVERELERQQRLQQEAAKQAALQAQVLKNGPCRGEFDGWSLCSHPSCMSLDCADAGSSDLQLTLVVDGGPKKAWLHQGQTHLHVHAMLAALGKVPSIRVQLTQQGTTADRKGGMWPIPVVQERSCKVNRSVLISDGGKRAKACAASCRGRSSSSSSTGSCCQLSCNARSGNGASPCICSRYVSFGDCDADACLFTTLMPPPSRSPWGVYIGADCMQLLCL